MMRASSACPPDLGRKPLENKLGYFEYLGPTSIFRLDRVSPPFGAKVLRRESNAFRKNVCAACGRARGMTDCAVVRDAEGGHHVVGVNCLRYYAANYVLHDNDAGGTPSKGGDEKAADPDNLPFVTKKERDAYWKPLAHAINDVRFHPEDRELFLRSLIVCGRAIPVDMPPFPKVSARAKLAVRQIRASYGHPDDLSPEDHAAVDEWFDVDEKRSAARSRLAALRTKLAKEMLLALPVEQRWSFPERLQRKLDF